MSKAAADRLPWVFAAAAVAVVLGLMTQRSLGAPGSALIVQSVAAGLGAGLAAVLAWRTTPPSRAVGTGLLIATLAAVAAPLLLGPELEGARRWLLIGPIRVQPSMILLPIALWSVCARRPEWMEGALIVAIGAVLALQFDAAASTGLALGWLAGPAWRNRRRLDWGVALMLGGMAAWTWMRPDALPSVDYVEQVVSNAWSLGLVAGGAATVATGLTVVPLVKASAQDRAVAGLAALQVGLVGSALVGNYPTPVAGYGASLVLGWFIALGLGLALIRNGQRS